MICNQCKSRNPIGGKFCRECAAPLPLPDNPLALDEAARAEKERLNERVAGLLSAAYTLAEQRRYDQALPLTEEAAMLLPNSTAALSLLATLYEYAGEDEKAIRAMERVVALNPESPGDRQKLGQLRRSFQQAQSDEPFPHRASAASSSGPPAAGPAPAVRPVFPSHTTGLERESPIAATIKRAPWIPYVLAGGTMACVLAVGLSAANSHKHATTPATGTERAAIAPGANSAELAANLGGAANAAQATPAPANYTPNLGLSTYGATGDPFVGSVGVNERPNNNRADNSNPYAGSLRQPSRNTYLPYNMGGNTGNNGGNNGNGNYAGNNAASNSGGSSNSDGGNQATLPPIIAVPPSAANSGNFAGNTQSDNRTGFGNGQQIAVGPPRTGSNASDGTASSAPTGYIQISPGHPIPAGSGGHNDDGITIPASAPGTTSRSGSGGSPLARARSLQVAKHYADAIDAYHDAIAQDSSVTGTAQQGIAQCQSAQGRDSEARTAYRGALHAYEAQLASGHNVAAAQTGINACKAALEALGSGN